MGVPYMAAIAGAKLPPLMIDDGVVMEHAQTQPLCDGGMFVGYVALFLAPSGASVFVGYNSRGERCSPERRPTMVAAARDIGDAIIYAAAEAGIPWVDVNR